jgi:flagellar biosynthesis component FlhA
LPFILIEGTRELTNEIRNKCNDMRQRIKDVYGFTVPGVNFTTIEEILVPSGTYYFRLFERINTPRGRVPLDKMFVNITPEQFAALGIEGEAPPEQDPPGFWIAEADWTLITKHDLKLWDATDYLLRRLEAVLEQHLGEFMNHEVATSLLKALGSAEGADIAESPEKLTALTVALRHLLHERLPIVRFADILHRFVRLNQADTSLDMIIDNLKSLLVKQEPARAG